MSDDGEDSDDSLERGLAVAHLLPSLGSPPGEEPSRIVDIAPRAPDDPRCGLSGMAGPSPVAGEAEANPKARPRDIDPPQMQVVHMAEGDSVAHPAVLLPALQAGHVQAQIS